VINSIELRGCAQLSTGGHLRATDGFRQQHAELLQLAKEISALFVDDRLREDATRVRLKLSTWARKLRVHMTLEDRLLYSRLLNHPDPVIRSKAAEHHREMDLFREKLTRYVSTRLERDFSDDTSLRQLIQTTKEVFESIVAKFAFEERELYWIDGEVTSGTWAVAQATALADDEQPISIRGGKT
jgi:hypothetical protein